MTQHRQPKNKSVPFSDPEPDAEVIRRLGAFAEGRLGIEAILEAFRGRIVDGRLLPFN
ncbi:MULTISPECIES: hypothetical protein [Gammaproteobacteria]|uniref:Transposase n=1 Tax=Bowmanella yangjiangensis TaxID=2811230 RepID=A0ABS3CZJ9_9ALTE|nr:MULTISPECIES: hypothetical protein [Gammaproteobacteria]MBN7822553.1 hypothetical protein [Bowmanella yangjiangensis]|tara:strand:- start:12028 stop:12201 length:174 start_codon:yes stop_codon:yes gene_type:complete